ncbi:MAG: T9SS type A sorting domain-containing protein [Bacteroidia bacterium]|nr:T9SS type A sorting domain-containing protein [Bacteroidia bacterium]
MKQFIIRSFLLLVLSLTFVYSGFSQLTANAFPTNVTCNGGNNGAVNLFVTGGLTPYSYLWSNAVTTQNLTGLTAGTYSVTVSDANGPSVGPMTWNYIITSTNHTILVPTGAVTINGNAIDANDFIGVFFNLSGGGLGCGGYSQWPSSGPAAVSAWGVDVGNDGFASGEAFKWKAWHIISGSNGVVVTMTATYNAGFPNQGNYSPSGMSGVLTMTGTYGTALTTTASAIVTQPAAITITGTTSNPSCPGSTNGAVNITVSGGTSPYTYHWSNNATIQNITGLAAGTYSVTTTDNHSCTQTAGFTLNAPVGMSLTPTSTNISCFSGSNGSINMVVTGGTTPYTYHWQNNATIQNLSGLASGTYSITVTDAVTCTATGTYTLTQPSIISATNTISNITCNGLLNGSISIVPSGGTPGYTFHWSNSATIQNLTALAAGTFNLTVTDANTCSVTFSYSVTQPAVLATTNTITNVSCNGGSNGAINLTVSGGTSPYTYLWQNSATSQNLNNVPAGTSYAVTVTDSHTCTVLGGPYTITQPAVLVVSGAGTNPSCPASTNGSVTITVSGGTSPYTYHWSNNATTQNASGLAAGIYSVTVTDNHSCTQTAGFTLNAPVAISLTPTTANISCNNGSNGSISLAVSGGATPYTYHWQNSASTQNLSGLTAGTYSVTVTDAVTCTATANYTLTQPTVVSVTNNITNITCNGLLNGSISITPSGGTPGYTYLWSNSTTTQNITGVAAGTFTLTVTDANICSFTFSYSITQPAVLATTNVITNVSCNGGSNGAIVLSVTGGTSPYTYHWQNNATTQNLNNIPAGTNYMVTVTDSHSCSVIAGPITITQPTALVISGTGTNPGCPGSSNGSVNITVSGGITPYTFHWSNNSTTQNISALTAGTYSITMTDNNNCTQTAGFTLNAPVAMTITPTTANISCSGGSNGSISLAVSGGATPYTYHWLNNATTQNLSGLTAGTYSVTVTDANLCTSSLSTTLTQPASLGIIALTSNYNGYNISYYGGSDGTITVTVLGGTTPYAYHWSNNATSQNLTAIAAGIYILTVTDNHSCTLTSSTTMTQPAQGSPIVVSGTETNETCFGGSNGSADITVSGGVPPYHYIWSNGATIQDLNNIAASIYNLTVTDSGTSVPVFNWTFAFTGVNHSILLQTNTIFINSNPIQNGDYVGVFYTTTNGLTCGGYTEWTGVNASITAWGDDPMSSAKDGFADNEAFNLKVWNTADGCAIDMTATWMTGQPNGGNFVANGLSGIASLNGTGTCPPPGPNSATFSITINQPTQITTTGVINNVTCNGANNGSVNITVTGGNSPYTYHWSTGATTQNLSALVAGTYIVTITDSHTCTNTAQYTVSEQASLTLTTVLSDYLGFNISANGASDGWIDLTVTGGTAPYTYIWSNGSTNQDLSNLPAGTYHVTVTDFYSCNGFMTITLTQPNPVIPLVANQVITNVSCYGLSDGAINLTVTGGVTPYTYFWSDSQTTEDISGLPAGTYTVTIIDASGTYGGPFNWTYTNTGSNHIILIMTNTVNLIGSPVQDGDYIGVFYHTPAGGLACGGYIQYNDTASMEVTAWGDDPTTPGKDGFNGGEAFTWKIKRQADGFESLLTPTYLPADTSGILNDSLFVVNGMSILSNLTANMPPTILPQILVHTVTVTQPVQVVITASSDTAVCAGTYATISVTGNASSYLWSNGSTATSQNVSPSVTTTYTVTGTTNGCINTDSVIVTVNSLPVVDLGADQNVVVNTPVTLDAGAFASYLWSTTASTQTITLLNTSVGIFTYSVTVTDVNDCEGSDEVVITVTAGVEEINDGNMIIVYPNPGTDYFNVMVENKQMNDYQVDILDLSGKLIISRQVKSGVNFVERFNVSSFAKGTYFVKVSYADKQKIKKLVIE